MVEGRRRRRAGGARREATLDVVLDVLATRGFEGTRFLDIAEASGIAISTLQNYFGSREDMLIEALLRLTAREVAELEKVAASEPGPWQRLVALLDRSLHTPRPTHMALVEFWHTAIRDDELRQASSDVQTRYRNPFVQAIQDGAAQGVFTTSRYTAEDIADYVLATLAGLIIPSAIGQTPPSPAAVHALLLDQLGTILGVTYEQTR
ncbi:TetR/AcrR family transcriptional regulator [Streptomyces sp. NPDC001068]|uniref:TetR/AcrR family transcriptional regulator n=1 Tax=Streptomyces sp. NPDC001068 TaxID=3364544 RepID=UPI0036BCC5AA